MNDTFLLVLVEAGVSFEIDSCGGVSCCSRVTADGAEILAGLTLSMETTTGRDFICRMKVSSVLCRTL